MNYFLAFVFLSLLLISCGSQRITFNPDFFMPDYRTRSIVNEMGFRVYADEERFNQFACMSHQKVIELMQLLMQTEAPIEDKQKALDQVNKLLKAAQ